MKDWDELNEEAEACEEIIRSIDDILNCLSDFPDMPFGMTDEELVESKREVSDRLQYLDSEIAKLDAEEKWEREQEYRRMAI